MRSGIPGMKRCVKTLEAEREGMPNGYERDKANATAKGINDSVKATKRIAHGCKKLSRLKKPYLLGLCCCKIIKREIKLNGAKTDID